MPSKFLPNIIMKKVLLTTLSAATIMLVLSSCGSKNGSEAGDAQNAATADSTAKEYAVIADQTTLAWAATKKVGGGHNGNINVSSGTLNIAGTEIKAGKFEVDMKSISVADITDPKKNADFVGHMMADDFFSVEKYQTSTFEISSVEKGATADSANVKGNLTIKGITKNINIPAKVTVADNKADVSAKFSIDRTEWEIKYGSGKFFTDLGDKVINDNIDFTLSLKAAVK